jgi:hypothetical protein
MEPRLVIAYSLILLMVVCFAAFVGYRIYHSHARSYARRLRREGRQTARTRSEREDGPSQ